jgi:hypothetical protein
MPAHLAASLGRPTWLLLKREADWRWGSGRADTPWYPSMRLFRQPGAADWAGCVDQVAGRLRRLTAAFDAGRPIGPAQRSTVTG